MTFLLFNLELDNNGVNGNGAMSHLILIDHPSVDPEPVGEAD